MTRGTGVAAAAVCATVMLCGCGAQQKAPETAPATAAPAAGSAEGSGALAQQLRSEDAGDRLPGLPAVEDYKRKADYLSTVCTEQGDVLKSIIERVRGSQHEPNRYQAMDYMSALQNPPASSCADFH
ncbi:hypothetical protein AB0C81_36050 [Streptomyces roseoverticillatus]|uniref:hypothetical protein n=1 Tax=Streptomyces roseoverticillatus TaxID=66429 RepID=UPI0033C7C2AA